MSKAADRSNKMSTEDLEAALASLSASVTESRAVSVELNTTRSSDFAMNGRRDTGL